MNSFEYRIKQVVPAKFKFQISGNITLLGNMLVSFMAPEKCDGNNILRSLETARKLRDRCIPVVGAFNNFLEIESLFFLLKGNQPLVIVQQDIESHPLSAQIRERLQKGNCLLIEVFPTLKRGSVDQTLRQIALELASENLIIQPVQDRVIEKSQIRILNRPSHDL